MSRTERSQEVERLRTEFGAVRHAILLNYRGITVPQVTDLRAQIRKSGGKYAVVKNTLLSRAVAGTALEGVKDSMVGPTAIAWSDSEPVALAKTLAAFAKTIPVLEIKALLLDGQPLPASQLETVATMPSKEELRARLVGLLASPLRRFVTVVSAPRRGLVGVLSQYAEKKK